MIFDLKNGFKNWLNGDESVELPLSNKRFYGKGLQNVVGLFF